MGNVGRGEGGPRCGGQGQSSQRAQPDTPWCSGRLPISCWIGSRTR
jgi:hypothetical protein